MMKTDYDLLIQQAEALTKDCPHLIANLANISALLYNTLDDINWAGFYLMEDFADCSALSSQAESGSPAELSSLAESSSQAESGSRNGETTKAAAPKLILGPFQGNPACIEIPLGKGVCGTAAKEDKTQLVPNVHEFPGHIACDSASRSEIVIPIHKKNCRINTAATVDCMSGSAGKISEVTSAVIGVLDIDSPSLPRFTEEDKAGLEELVKLLEQTCL